MMQPQAGHHAAGTQLSSLPQAQAQLAPVQMAVTCPPDARPGDSMAVTMGGRHLMVQVPEGVAPGGVFMVQPPGVAKISLPYFVHPGVRNRSVFCGALLACAVAGHGAPPADDTSV